MQFDCVLLTCIEKHTCVTIGAACLLEVRRVNARVRDRDNRGLCLEEELNHDVTLLSSVRPPGSVQLVALYGERCEIHSLLHMLTYGRALPLP